MQIEVTKKVQLVLSMVEEGSLKLDVEERSLVVLESRVGWVLQMVSFTYQWSDRDLAMLLCSLGASKFQQRKMQLRERRLQSANSGGSW